MPAIHSSFVGRFSVQFKIQFDFAFCDLPPFDRRNAFLLLHFTFFCYKESQAKNAGQDVRLFNP